MNFKLYVSESFKYLLRSYPLIRSRVRHVERLYAMTATQRMEYENAQFIKIFDRAIHKSPFYKELYGRYGISADDIKSIGDIAKLPVIDKSMIRHRSSDLLTRSRWFVKASHTSGTTGEPLVTFDDWNMIWSEQAYHYCFYKRCGYIPGRDRAVSLRGHLGHNDIELNLHIAKTLLMSSYNIRQTTVARYYESIVRYRPKVILGYPSSLYNLAQLFEENGMSLSIPLCITSSETLYDYQRKTIESVLGCRIFDLYGNTEHAGLLYEAESHNGYFAAPGYAHIEIDGDSIIATPLVNASFPLIRYRMNDAFDRDDDMGGYSWNQPVIASRIVGKTAQCIVCYDSTRISRLGFLFKHAVHIKMAQIVQYEIGRIEINIVPDDGFGREDTESIGLSIAERIGAGNIDYKINIIDRDGIIYSSRNKFSQIVSYL